MNPDYTLCLVTDRGLLRGKPLAWVVEQAVLGGCSMVQLREKALPSADFYQLALEIKAVTRRLNVPLIINDRLDIALAVGAAGVHLGQRDLPASAARKILRPGMLLGVSAATAGEAVQAARDGADYLGVGAVFPTATKADAKAVPLEEVADIRRAVSLPILAIGGITKENARLFRPMGINGVAAVSAIMAADGPKAAAIGLRQAFLHSSSFPGR